MKVHNKITRNLISILLSALIARFLGSLVLGKNEVYQLGISLGEHLHDIDDNLDPKDLDAEIQLLGEQMGTAPVVDKLLGSDEFLDGVALGYYQEEILDSAPFKKS